MTTPPPSSRRDLIHSERRRAEARIKPSMVSAMRVAVRRPARASAVSRPAAGPSSSTRPTLRRRFLSGLTILFVAAVTVVTTIPVNSLLTPGDLAAASTPEVLVTRLAPQELAAVTGGADVAIPRDSYTVTEKPKPVVAASGGQTPQFVGSGSGAVRWPVASGTRMSDQFGPRVLCDGCEVTMHRGVDFLPGRGAPIQAIADGVVRYVEESDSGLGVHVIVDHRIDGELVSSVYCHMEFGSVAVSEGQTVGVGQLIGTVGDTGFAFGPHLHFEIRLNGTENVDPVAWLNANAG